MAQPAKKSSRLSRETISQETISQKTITVDFVLNQQQCIGCAVCADICDYDALDFMLQAVVPVWKSELCTGCKQCDIQCPTGAIQIISLQNETS